MVEKKNNLFGLSIVPSIFVLSMLILPNFCRVDKQEIKLPVFQIHRGYLDNGKNIENTIKAFRAAKIYGHNMIELDIRLSKDKQVMVYHDDNLRRLSDHDETIRDHTAEELGKYSIPTLKQVFRDEKTPYFINVELKPASEEDEGLENALLQVLMENNAMDRVIISSFSATALGRVAHMSPQLERNYLTAKSDTESDEEFLDRINEPLLVAQTQKIHIYFGSVTERLAALLVKNSISFRVWTVNTQEDCSRMLRLGATGIITDRVDLKP